MLESCYWKDDLERSLCKLLKWQKQRRWSDRSICLFEKEIIITFFQIRKLIEAHKLTDRCRIQNLTAIRYNHIGHRVDVSNRWPIEELYALSHGKKSNLLLAFVANQIIHSFIIGTVFLEEGTPEGIMVSSDFRRNDYLYHFSLSELLRAIREVVTDDIVHLEMRRDLETKDMEVVGSSYSL